MVPCALRTGGLAKAAGGALAVGLAAALLFAPGEVVATARFVLAGLAEVAPIVAPGIVLAAWITASGASGRVAALFQGRARATVLAASAVGALTPVCGITVLPLLAGLLSAGVPLAPVMAFWLSSPVTDPAMLATTAATLGLPFAIAKTAAAFGLGLVGGAATALLARQRWVQTPLRDNGFVGRLGRTGGSEAFRARIWRDRARTARFWRDARSLTRLILISLTPAFAAEYALNGLLRADALSAYVGAQTRWAVPLAVLVGAPAYVDGYAALPLVRALLEHGMAPGAALAFLVSGGVVSIWGALAIAPVLRVGPFLLYLALALTGSMAAGWTFGALV